MSINAHLPTCPFVAAVATVTSGAAAISLWTKQRCLTPSQSALLLARMSHHLHGARQSTPVVVCKDLLPSPLTTGASTQWSLAVYQAGRCISKIFRHGQSGNHPSLDAKRMKGHWYAAEQFSIRRSSYANPLALNGAWSRHGKRDMHPIIASWRKPVP
jgi:hypothetical protein